MKEFNPETIPNSKKDISPKYKLIAYTTLLAVRDFLGDDQVEKAQIIVHSTGRCGEALIKELKTLGLKVIGFCHGQTCRWNTEGVDLKNGKDKELDMSTSDTYALGGDVVIFDEARVYIDEEDSKSFTSKILIETGNFITHDAKTALQKRGVEVIPHQFFELYPIERARPENVNDFADSIGENWEKVSNYAKEEDTSFDTAFEYFVSQKMV